MSPGQRAKKGSVDRDEPPETPENLLSEGLWVERRLDDDVTLAHDEVLVAVPVGEGGPHHRAGGTEPLAVGAHAEGRIVVHEVDG